jgi:hypothetical protein
MNLDTTNTITIQHNGKSYVFQVLTAREYSKLLRATMEAKTPADIIEYYLDLAAKKIDAKEIESLPWSDFRVVFESYIQANAVSPDDKKKSE